MNKKQVIVELDKFIKRESKGDRPSLRKFRGFIREGKYREALSFFDSLDTYLRDGVPDSILLFIRRRDETRKLYKVQFSLVDESGKPFISAIGEYRLSKEEKNSPLFASSVLNAGNDWRDKVAKLQIKEINS